MYGLLDRDFKCIQEALKRYPEIHKVIIFGSRALGNYKRGSDVDLAIIGAEITQRVMSELNVSLNEDSPLPYVFDLHHYDSLSNQKLKDHIDQFGKAIYEMK